MSVGSNFCFLNLFDLPFMTWKVLLFEAMGHPEDRVHVMQGSLKDRLAGGGPVADC